MSAHRLPPTPELVEWIESRRPFPEHAAYIEQRYAAEPYRLVLSLLAADLAEASAEKRPNVCSSAANIRPAS